MEEKYFSCDPVACNAECCRSISTKPVMTFGDFLRIGQHLGKTATDIWLESGNVAVVPLQDREGIAALAALALFHNPCPYLSEQNKCNIYNSRPLGCLEFPFTAIEDGHVDIEGYHSLDCMKNVRLFPAQRKLCKAVGRIAEEETRLDIELFWSENLRGCIDIFSQMQYEEIARRALGVIANGKVSPAMAREVRISAGEMHLLISSKGYDSIGVRELCNFLEPMVYAIKREQFAEVFRKAEKFKHRYKKTSDELRKLAGFFNSF